MGCNTSLLSPRGRNTMYAHLNRIIQNLFSNFLALFGRILSTQG
nr:MAG TPA: hypothetical protein [Caudoviricetes sp.]